jgi:anti-sigma-K factor RskA
MTCPHGYSDGAYVLGALSPAERTEYHAHLAKCEPCAAAVAALAPIPGLLGRVDSAALRPAEPESGRLAQLLAAVADQRRRQVRVRRWRLAAASLTAAAVAAVGVVAVGSAGWFAPADDQPPASAVAMTPVEESLPVTAQVAVAEAPGGTEVWMACQYEGEDGSPAHPYWLVAYGTDGTKESLGSWEVAPGDEITMTGRSRYSTGELARLELQGAGGATLLIYDLR